MVGTFETLLRGLLVAGLLVVPGLLLVRAAWPTLDRGATVLAGVTAGLFVVPSLAFGVALLVGSNLRLPVLASTSVLVASVALAWARWMAPRDAPRDGG